MYRTVLVLHVYCNLYCSPTIHMRRLLSGLRRSLNRTSRTTTSTQSLPYHVSSTCTCPTTSAACTTQPPTPSNTHRRTYQTSATPHQASTFVSAHFRIEEKTITDFLKRIKAKFRRTTTHLILEECPSCSPHKNKQDNKDTYTQRLLYPTNTKV